jgi:hypothetical protein
LLSDRTMFSSANDHGFTVQRSWHRERKVFNLRGVQDPEDQAG